MFHKGLGNYCRGGGGEWGHIKEAKGGRVLCKQNSQLIFPISGDQSHS